MKITVLCGGPSDEREVSLISGQAVATNLRLAGHEVFVSDIMPDNLAGLDHPADVIFPVLHGRFGEDGQVQQILESRHLRFVGSDAKASALGFDKVATKVAWQKAGLPTPAWQVLTKDSYHVGFGPDHIKPPCVVKPLGNGSSIDVFICHTANHAIAACDRVVAKYGLALVEQFIKGTELTCGVIGQDTALPPIWIRTTHEFYDYDAKYKGNTTQYLFDTGLAPEVVTETRVLATKAHQTLGCRDLSRTDMIVDAENRPWLLEINTLPGFTSHSLLPKAAKEAGIEFPQLVDRLVRMAAERN